MMNSRAWLVFLTRWDTVFALLILVAFIAIKYNSMLMPEHLDIPQTVIPSPNAYDYYHQAAARLTDSEAFGYTKLAKPIPITKQEEIVADNEQVMPLLNKGLAAKFAIPNDTKLKTESNENTLDETMQGLVNDSSLTEYPQGLPSSDIHRLGKLLGMRSDVAAARGRWDEALSDRIDRIQIGVELTHGGGFVNVMNGLGVQVGACHDIQAVIEHSSAVAAKNQAQRLSVIDHNQLAYADILTQQKYMGQMEMLETFRNRQSYLTRIIQGRSYKKSGSEMQYLLESTIGAVSCRSTYDDYTNHLDQLISNARHPWSSFKRLSRVPDSDNFVVRLACTGLENLSALSVKQSAVVVEDRLLETQLSLHAYKLEHGVYPASLNQLSPGYLSAVPTDPFADDAPLRYRLIGDKYDLYSIGPDGIDNGGQAILNDNNTARKYSAQEGRDAKGDIVAGVNY